MKKEEENKKELGADDMSDDLVFEDLEDKNPQNLIKKLREKLKRSESEKQESMTALQRTKADFINLRKRDEKDKEEFAKFAVENFINKIIPVLDSFDSAIKKAEEAKDIMWKDGVSLIQSQLMNVLKNHGVEKINPLNEHFDPKFHEAVGTILTEDEDKDHIILEVFQPGYSLYGKIVRPAKVRIGQKI